MQIRLPLIVLCLLFPQQVLAQNPPRVGVKRGRITLPPKPPKESEVQRPVTRRNDPDQFYRDVIDLRRSKVLTEKNEEQLLRDLQKNHDNPAAMAIDLSLRCRNDLLYGLMKVVDRYGSKYHAEELHFQVLSRPLGRATERVIKTIAGKSGSNVKNKLFDYLVCKYAPARNAAVDRLRKLLVAEDIPTLIQLSRHEKADIRRKVISLLAGVPDARVRERLLEILAQDPSAAADACVAAIAQGEPMVEPLGELLRRPARGKEFGYACLALSRLESQLGSDLFTQDMVGPILSELGGDDPFLCAASGIALGVITYRSSDWTEEGQHDKRIVDNLLSIVAPDQFITSMRLLKPAAAEALVNFTGRDFQGRTAAWRGWWGASRSNFVGLRRALSVTADNASRVLLTWTTGEHFLVFRGPEVPDDQMPAESRPVFLDPGEMLDLVRDLQNNGFMSAMTLPTTAKVWKIDMRIDDSRILMRVEPRRDGKGRAENVHKVFVEVARAQLWQKHRDPDAHPDARAFWSTERKWLTDNPGQVRQRLVAAIVARLPKLDSAGRKEALDDLQSVDGLPHLITELHGSALVRVARAQDELDPSDFRLLEFAALAPGETVWRQALAVLDGRVTGAGDNLATRLFRLLGSERALMSIKHPSKRIAIAAMHDAAATKHRAAESVLLARMQDADVDVQRTAIYALGVLKSAQARETLLRYEGSAPPVIRREIWAALGRIGGPEVVPILKRGMENPSLIDRLALLSAMGHTKSGELARFLSARYASQGATPNEFSQRAELSLRTMGPLLAAPALRQHLQMGEGPARRQLVLFLAELQDPMVVEDLISYLRNPNLERVAASRLSEITGVDLRAVNNRSQAMRVWYSYNKAKTQGEWYLGALALAQIPTSLKPEQLAPRIGIEPIAELVRLLVVVKQTHLQVMTATLLRETTGVDFTRGVRFAEVAAREAIAARYKIHGETVRATGK